MVFLGRRGRRDDVVAAARALGAAGAEATLPVGARRGPPKWRLRRWRSRGGERPGRASASQSQRVEPSVRYAGTFLHPPALGGGWSKRRPPTPRPPTTTEQHATRIRNW